MKEIFIGLLVCIIMMCWYLANIYSKPKLNRLSNYYEEDKEGRTIANIFIGGAIVVAFTIGYIYSKYL